MQAAAQARQLAAATTYQAPQEVVMGRIIPSRHLLVLVQPRLCQIEHFLADECRHGNGDPLRDGSRLLALAWSNRLERRFPPPGRSWVAATAVGLPDIGLRAQDAPDTGDIPAHPAGGGRDLVIAEPLGYHI
jgi:hypothetical protein